MAPCDWRLELSEVTIDDNNAFKDGYVVAKSFISTQTYEQVHGSPYKGGLQRISEPVSADTPTATSRIY